MNINKSLRKVRKATKRMNKFLDVFEKVYDTLSQEIKNLKEMQVQQNLNHENELLDLEYSQRLEKEELILAIKSTEHNKQRVQKVLGR